MTPNPSPRTRRHLRIGVISMLALAFAVAILLSRTEWGSATATAEAAIIKPQEAELLIAATLENETTEGQAAEEMNDALPFSSAPVETATPFTLTAARKGDEERALKCMTQAIYYEAGFEPAEGRRAVAQVVLNRMKHPAFPRSVCGVVYQGSNRPGCQFSFTCDGSLLRTPEPRAWAEAQKIAQQALVGKVENRVGTATHYHANYVSPNWAPKLSKIVKLGAHIFYRWPGNWGRRIAFSAHYGGNEFIPPLSSLANINAIEVPGLVEESGPALPRIITDRRTDNDVGGRIDPSKGWKLSIPMPTETASSYRNLTMAQTPASMATTAQNNTGDE